MIDNPEGFDGRDWNSPLRKKLAKRAANARASINHMVPTSEQKTPSEKRGIAFRKRLASRDGGKPPEKTIYPSDCRDCKELPTCTSYGSLEFCSKHSLLVRCTVCGQMYRVRIIPDTSWEKCVECRKKDGVGNVPGS